MLIALGDTRPDRRRPRRHARIGSQRLVGACAERAPADDPAALAGGARRTSGLAARPSRGASNRRPLAIPWRGGESQRDPGQPRIDRSAVPFAVRRRRRCDAEPVGARALRDRVRQRLRGLSRKHQGTVLDPVLALPGLRPRRRRLRRCAVPIRRVASSESRLSFSAVSFRPLPLSRHGHHHSQPRLRRARGRGRHRWRSRIELRG